MTADTPYSNHNSTNSMQRINFQRYRSITKIITLYNIRTFKNYFIIELKTKATL